MYKFEYIYICIYVHVYIYSSIHMNTFICVFMYKYANVNLHLYESIARCTTISKVSNIAMCTAHIQSDIYIYLSLSLFSQKSDHSQI